MPRTSPHVIALTPEERRVLEARSRRYTAALAWLLPSTSTASAQEEMTTQEALEELQREIERGASSLDHPYLPAIYILRQVYGPRAPAELDAFADQVAAMAADATLPEHVRRNAEIALSSAADLESGRVGHEGTPYARGFDLLVQVYESGNDVLYAILDVDPQRGPAYVQDVFERSERPPLCYWGHGDPLGNPPPGGPPWCDEDYQHRRDARETTWCRVGGLLFEDIVAEAWERTPGGEPAWQAGEPMPVPEGLPEHVDDWHRRCR